MDDELSDDDDDLSELKSGISLEELEATIIRMERTIEEKGGSASTPTASTIRNSDKDRQVAAANPSMTLKPSILDMKLEQVGDDVAPHVQTLMQPNEIIDITGSNGAQEKEEPTTVGSAGKPQSESV